MRFLVVLFLALGLCHHIVVSYPARLQAIELLDDGESDNIIRLDFQAPQKRRSQLRNCYFSPVQCLLPVDHRFNKLNKRYY